MITILTIGLLMMLPMIGGAITFVYSIEATKDIGNDPSRDI